MDKLDLDARLARLERRVGLHAAVLLIAGVGLGVFLTFGLHALRASSRQQATVVTPPLPPTMPPVMSGMAAPPPVPINMMDPMGGMMGGMEGGMPLLQQRLGSLKQLRDEGLIAEEEWKAMKAKALEAPLTPGEIRSDLQAVQHLFDAGVIGETERAGLRAKLLGVAD